MENNNNNPKLALLCGGSSEEREVSLATGAAVAKALTRLGYHYRQYDLDLEFYQDAIGHRFDRVFIALHGSPGEDGTVQGFLDLMQIPYTGSGQLSSALAMDKWQSKQLYLQAGIPTPPSRRLKNDQELELAGLPFPLVLKPVDGGSALGVLIVENPQELAAAQKTLCQYPVLLAEAYICGREFTVGILGDQALPVLEILPQARFYDYESKYAPGGSTHKVPAELDDKLAYKMQEIALNAHKVLGCSGATRTDILLDQNQNPYVLETNTIPGMTETSLLPEEAAAVGISFDQLVNKIIQATIQ